MRKDIDGKWHFEENWFLNHVWGINFWLGILEDKPIYYPKSLCSLFWGSLFGIAFSLIGGVITVSCVALIICLIVVAGICGFYPEADKKGEDLFGNYKHWRGRKIPIALWEVFVVVLAAYLLLKYHLAIWSFLKAVLVIFTAMISSSPVLIGCLLFVAGIGTYLFFLKTTPGRVCWEYAKAAYRKMCPFVVIDKKSGNK